MRAILNGLHLINIGFNYSLITLNNNNLRLNNSQHFQKHFQNNPQKLHTIYRTLFSSGEILKKKSSPESVRSVVSLGLLIFTKLLLIVETFWSIAAWLCRALGERVEEG